MAMQFDGTNYLESVDDYTVTEEGSLCFWMNPSVVGGENIRILGSGDLFEVLIDPVSEPNVRCDIYNGLGTNSSIVIVIDTLYHVVVTWSVVGGNVTCEIFIDGVSVGSNIVAATTPNTAKLRIGSRTGSEGHFSGILDDVRIYNRIFNTGEIQTIYASEGTDDIVYGLQNRWVLTE